MNKEVLEHLRRAKPNAIYEVDRPIWDSTSTIPSYSSTPSETAKHGVIYELHPDGVSGEDEYGESFEENAAEYFDPTGFLSYNDTARAYEDFKNTPSWRNFGNLTLEGIGALPIAPPVKKWYTGFGKTYNAFADTLKKLYGPAMEPIKALNKFDAVQDVYEENLPK